MTTDFETLTVLFTFPKGLLRGMAQEIGSQQWCEFMEAEEKRAAKVMRAVLHKRFLEELT